MKKYSSYRAAARESLRGNWTPAVLTVLVYVVVVEAVSGVAGLPAAPLFAAQNLTWGIIVSCALALAAAILFPLFSLVFRSGSLVSFLMLLY